MARLSNTVAADALPHHRITSDAFPRRHRVVAGKFEIASRHSKTASFV